VRQEPTGLCLRLSDRPCLGFGLFGLDDVFVPVHRGGVRGHVSPKGIPMKKTWSFFLFAPLLALTLAAVGCESTPEIDPADSDTSEGDIELTEEEEAGEMAIGEN
jgi:hypothetical protein